MKAIALAILACWALKYATEVVAARWMIVFTFLTIMFALCSLIAVVLGV